MCNISGLRGVVDGEVERESAHSRYASLIVVSGWTDVYREVGGVGETRGTTDPP